MKKLFVKMLKCFLSILLVISTCAVISHNALACQVNTVYSVLDGKAGSDEKSGADIKEDGKDKIFSVSRLFLLSCNGIFQKTLDNLVKCSKGFFNTPYNPPETI